MAGVQREAFVVKASAASRTLALFPPEALAKREREKRRLIALRVGIPMMPDGESTNPRALPMKPGPYE